jgi:hypothetical protein
VICVLLWLRQVLTCSAYRHRSAVSVVFAHGVHCVALHAELYGCLWVCVCVAGVIGRVLVCLLAPAVVHSVCAHAAGILHPLECFVHVFLFRWFEHKLLTVLHSSGVPSSVLLSVLCWLCAHECHQHTMLPGKHCGTVATCCLHPSTGGGLSDAKTALDWYHGMDTTAAEHGLSTVKRLDQDLQLQGKS